MNEEKINRINELYHKSKRSVGLTPEEAEEQAKLRAEYIESVKNNLRSQLNSITIENPDGTRKKLSDYDKTKDS